ncbi:hypothetical protein [Kitasatospora sp. NPDC101183]|uniref:hypothetical protein n=1 Tax=Kitasatospora sp. NPDC101183 TaxID=3364100 RepID=UPI00382F3F9C
MSTPTDNRTVISYASRHFSGEPWTDTADRWTATFYYNGAEERLGTATITRVIPNVSPNPREALASDPGFLDRIPRVIFDEDGSLAPALDELEPAMLLLLESVEVREEWRGTGLGSLLAMEALKHLAVPGTVAVTYPAPLHDVHAPGEVCPYESDDPMVRRLDEEGVGKLRKMWEGHGFLPLADGVYACRIEP